VRRVTALIFICAILLGSAAFFVFFRGTAMNQVRDEARVLMQAAMAMREYTVAQITPNLEIENEFHPETVPSFAAQNMFERLSAKTSGYSYREAALNPTNPEDLATPFEADLIAKFRSGDEKELSGIRWQAQEPIFYLARPIRIESQACLVCHSEPEAAPVSMLDIYGRDGGFGWQVNEVVAVQLLTVPVDKEYRSIYEMVAVFFAILVVLFLAVSVIITMPLQRHIIQPLRQLAAAADRASIRTDDVDLPERGAGEIVTLSRAIARLRASMSLTRDKPEEGRK
jgi:protein-histidine pros-kinase